MKKQKIVALSVLCIALVLFASFAFLDSTQTKTYRLNDQYIGFLSPERTQGLTPCSNCLIMEVQEERHTSAGLVTEDYTLFFANENELLNELQQGDMINVRWKNVDGHSVIRGVWKA